MFFAGNMGGLESRRHGTISMDSLLVARARLSCLMMICHLRLLAGQPRADDYTGRGGSYVYYGNDTRFFIAPR